MQLYNSLTKQKEHFHPLQGNTAGLYTCGPTVYDYAHIGNLRTYVFEDILKRVLKYNGFAVNHVMNITDVGHLTDDADAGEDKMEKGARREGKTAWEIAEFYTVAFKQNMVDLNILEPNIWCKATDHIPEQISLIQRLIDKGFTYQTSDGIYFDTTKLPDYGKLVDLQKQELKAGARVGMGEKKNPHDFALWKFTSTTEKRQMEWPFDVAPFDVSSGRTQDKSARMGFPGWHIECSAMAMKYLGEHFDIHCGGIDHKPVHHTNEIAQSEAATGIIPWVRFWLHGEFLTIDNPSTGSGSARRMGKSEGNFLTLDSIKEKGFDPLSYRYFLLLAHYRKQLSFSWQALEAAQNGLQNLRRLVSEIPDNIAPDRTHEKIFLDAINDDLNMPEAVAALWTGLKEKTLALESVIMFDKVLGLNLHEHAKAVPLVIPSNIQTLLDQRASAREAKDFKRSDELRDAMLSAGYLVEDTKDGQKLRKK